MNANTPLQPNFVQVCVWPAAIVGAEKVAEFLQWGLDEFGSRFQYLEEIKTHADSTAPGGRNDLFFAVHRDDVAKFAVPRLAYGIRWVEDVYGNGEGRLYPERVVEYKNWGTPEGV